jgi:hypothetical protein
MFYKEYRTVFLEKHGKSTKKVPAVLFVKHTILVDLIKKNHVTLYTNLPYCTVHYNCRSSLGGTTRKSDNNDGRRHIRIVTSQSKNKTINHQGHQSIKNYQGKNWCEGLV